MNGITTKYYYDMQGRMMGYDEKGTDHSVSVLWGYDDLNNLNSQKITINGTTYTESYAYDKDNRITQSTAGSVVSAYTYDTYSRMTKIVNKNSSTAVVTTDIGYLNPSNTATTGLVHTWKNTYSTTNKTSTYTYDNRGNITSISDGTNTTTYTYDQYDQLLRENNQEAGKTWVYDYDTAGNILSKTEYAYTTGELGTAIDTIEYKYDDETWHELLTEYDGQEISYDGIGNMTSDGTWTYTWEHGRQLATATDGTTSVSYEYNADGMRLSKTVGSTTTKYYYVGSQLVEMTQGSDKLHFTYDATGASAVTYGNATYYYLKNAQGDILGIVNTSGTVVVSYTYDAWGNVLSVTGSMASTLGAMNPLRYRGYVYDTETGLYYVASRYYDPEIGRFICADGYTTTGYSTLGANMYVYCNNNPVNYIDPNGTTPIKVLVCGPWVVVQTLIVAGPYVGIQENVVSGMISYAKKVPDRSDKEYEVSEDGSQERWYGPDGKPVRDKHNTDHGNSKKHPDVPHGHDWGEENGQWQPGPPYPWPQNPASSTNMLNGVLTVAGGAAAAYGVYLGIKWIAAIAFAAPTGGASIGIALVTP